MSKSIKIIASILVFNLCSQMMDAQNSSKANRNLKESNKKIKNENLMEYAPFVMKVRIKKDHNNKRVVYSVGIKDRALELEEKKRKKYTTFVTSKDEILLLRKSRKKRKKRAY